MKVERIDIGMMDLEKINGSAEVVDPGNEGIDENLSHSFEGVAIDAACGTDGTPEEMGNDLISDKELKERPQDVIISDTLYSVDRGTSYNSRNLVHGKVLEMCVVIESVQTEYVNGDNRKLEAKINESGLNKVSIKELKGACETDNKSCVIDLKCGNCKGFSEHLEGERVCRICHLASRQPLEDTVVVTANSATSADLIQLGCACKDDLGIAHSHCAEAWFKLKGNRLCEICGETAKNVSGVADDVFIEEWNARRFIMVGSTSSRRFGGCWRGQPFCNFLMACLVIAFVLPWFFSVHMF